MKTIFTLTAAALVSASAMFSLPAQAQETKAGDLVISQPWSRATPGGAKVGGGYLVIENKGTTPDTLIGGTTAVASSVEVHEMAVTNGVMTMRQLKQGLPVEPGKSVTLKPGGYHLMLVGLKQPLKQGETVPVTLQFEKAGKVDLSFEVRAIGAGAHGGGHDHDAGHDHGHSGKKGHAH